MSDPHEVSCDHLIWVDWLRQTVLVFNDLEESRSELERFGGNPDAALGGAGYATNDIDGSGLFWMVFPGGNPSIITIVHECIHVVDYLLEFAGIPIDAENSEVRCYMTEWLVGQIMQKYEMKVKHA